MKSWGKRVRDELILKERKAVYVGELFEGPGMVFTGVVAREVG